MSTANPQRLAALLDLARARPDDPFVHYGIAMEHKAAGDVDRAAASFADLMARFPDYVPTYLMAGQLLAAAGRRDEARAALERGVAAATRRGDAHALGEIREALADL